MAKRFLGDFFNRLFLIASVATVVFGGFFVYGESMQAFAARQIAEVTVNGGQIASVQKDEMVNVSMTVESTGVSNWASTKYKIGKEAWICIDTPNHLSGTTATEAFQIKAPSQGGVYQTLFKAYGGNNCTINHGSPVVLLVNGIIVNTPADTKAPMILGLASESASVKNKTWNWSADEFATFRYSLSKDPSIKPSGDFSKDNNSASLVGGVDPDGKYFLRVQARDNAGNMSSKLVTVTLASTTDMSKYNAEVARFVTWEALEADNTLLDTDKLFAVWSPYKAALDANVVTEANTQAEVDQATKNLVDARITFELGILRLLFELGR